MQSGSLTLRLGSRNAEDADYRLLENSDRLCVESHLHIPPLASISRRMARPALPIKIGTPRASQKAVVRCERHPNVTSDLKQKLRGPRLFRRL